MKNQKLDSITVAQCLRGRNSGQALIEYLVLVAVIGVGSILAVRAVGYNLQMKMASVAAALAGEEKKYKPRMLDRSVLNRKHLGNFMNGVGE